MHLWVTFWFEIYCPSQSVTTVELYSAETNASIRDMLDEDSAVRFDNAMLNLPEEGNNE